MMDVAHHAQNGLSQWQIKESVDQMFVEQEKNYSELVNAKNVQISAEEMEYKKNKHIPNASQTNALEIKY